jgi:8-oxo-dGTP pyrophosphatase MutT (NUDIX family)
MCGETLAPMPSDDPTELFDLCTPDGYPLRRTKPRGLVHRDGDWHRSLHVWVVLTATSPASVLFQRRSLTKDSHPGKVDVSVAGHLRAGETVFDALREAEEEIGLVVQPTELIRLGLRRRVDDRSPTAIDCEVQDVFAVFTSRPLETLRPDPDEVTGLLEVPLPAALAFVRGEAAHAAGHELSAGQTAAHGVILGRNELLPDPDGYFALALGSILDAEKRPWSLG